MDDTNSAVDTTIHNPNTHLVSRVAMLRKYHNSHLNKLLMARINLNLFKTLDDNEVVDGTPIQMPGGEVVIKKIKVSQKRPMTIIHHNQAVEMLRVIEEMLVEEGEKLDKSVLAYDLLPVEEKKEVK